jgi:hypothetical protein
MNCFSQTHTFVLCFTSINMEGNFEVMSNFYKIMEHLVHMSKNTRVWPCIMRSQRHSVSVCLSVLRILIHISINLLITNFDGWWSSFCCVLRTSDIEKYIQVSIYNPGVMVCVGWMFSYTVCSPAGLKHSFYTAVLPAVLRIQCDSEIKLPNAQLRTACHRIAVPLVKRKKSRCLILMR